MYHMCSVFIIGGVGIGCNFKNIFRGVTKGSLVLFDFSGGVARKEGVNFMGGL